MKPLSLSDALFLLIEARRYPMHVAGLQLYTMPEGAEPEFARSRRGAQRGSWRARHAAALG